MFGMQMGGNLIILLFLNLEPLTFINLIHITRMQNMDILNAAIQKQEKALRIARNKLHDESLIRELSGQLETLNKAKYSD